METQGDGEKELTTYNQDKLNNRAMKREHLLNLLLTYSWTGQERLSAWRHQIEAESEKGI
eukprot:scaffold26270_cov60-Attheya_sp.AAC.9